MFEYIWILVAYVCGCVNGAYYIGKIVYAYDIRDNGSGNAGARNAGRVFGKSAFVFTVVIDAVKVIIPLLVAIFLVGVSEGILACMALALLVAHIWPIQLHFRGGKGVVVYLALTLVLLPFALLFIGLIILILYLLTRRLTIPAMIGFTVVPLLFFIEGKFMMAAVFLIMLLIVMKMHRNGGQG